MKKYIIFFLFLVSLTSCYSYKKGYKRYVAKWNPFLGTEITVTGEAVNMKAGANLRMFADSTHIWIKDFHSWPLEYYLGENKWQAVRVTGTVIEQYDLPVFKRKSVQGIVPQGMPISKWRNLKDASHRYLLKDVIWEIVSDDSILKIPNPIF